MSAGVGVLAFVNTELLYEFIDCSDSLKCLAQNCYMYCVRGLVTLEYHTIDVLIAVIIQRNCQKDAINSLYVFECKWTYCRYYVMMIVDNLHKTDTGNKYHISYNNSLLSLV